MAPNFIFENLYEIAALEAVVAVIFVVGLYLTKKRLFGFIKKKNRKLYKKLGKQGIHKSNVTGIYSLLTGKISIKGKRYKDC